MRIELRGSAPPADQIADQLRGLIGSGQLAADERLPSVRQFAGDLGVAPGTVAKAYRALETEGLLVARIGRGTRVSRTAATTPLEVMEAARALAEAGDRHGIDADEAVRIVRAVWRSD